MKEGVKKRARTCQKGEKSHQPEEYMQEVYLQGGGERAEEGSQEWSTAGKKKVSQGKGIDFKF